MDTIIGITEDRLSQIIYEASRQAYERGRRDAEQKMGESQMLHSMREIIEFLSPERPFTKQTFNANRRKGMYGDAIMGRGSRCSARKDELLDAIKRYHLMHD